MFPLLVSTPSVFYTQNASTRRWYHGVLKNILWTSDGHVANQQSCWCFCNV